MSFILSLLIIKYCFLDGIKKPSKLTKSTLLVIFFEDGDEAGNMSEVLNRIEKFRQEIKYKYRSYLEKKEISLMAKQLRNLQKEAQKRYIDATTYTYTEANLVFLF